MVWVHGGGFNVGNSHDIMFDGSVLADEDDVVVVSLLCNYVGNYIIELNISQVTLNYRLVVFGFPSGVDGVDLNVGLQDQRLATQWVKDNIANFGGKNQTQRYTDEETHVT
jgi:cholinesterase